MSMKNGKVSFYKGQTPKKIQNLYLFEIKEFINETELSIIELNKKQKKE